MKLQEWGIILSGTLAITSLFYNIYKDFIQGPELRTVITHFVLLKLGDGNKEAIQLEILCDLLLSTDKKPFVHKLLQQHTRLVQPTVTGNRQSLKNEILNIKNISIDYDITDEDIRKYIGSEHFVNAFYIPIVALNAGRKSGQISTLFIKITSLDNKKYVWIYNCEMEIDPIAISKAKITDSSANLLSKIFPGISIAPFSSARIDGFFVEYKKTHKLTVSTTNLIPGNYKIKVIAYDAKQRKVMESNEAIFKLSEREFYNCFRGTNYARNLTADDNISKEVLG